MPDLMFDFSDLENTINKMEEIYKDRYCNESTDDTEDEEYRLSAPYILFKTLNDFRVDVGDWEPDYWECVFDNLMSRLEKAKYIVKGDE